MQTVVQQVQLLGFKDFVPLPRSRWSKPLRNRPNLSNNLHSSRLHQTCQEQVNQRSLVREQISEVYPMETPKSLTVSFPINLQIRNRSSQRLKFIETEITATLLIIQEAFQMDRKANRNS